MANEKPNQPAHKYRAGAITATMWENKAQGKDGKEYTFLTTTVTRSYKDKEDEWQNTNALRTNDLPRAILVLQQAFAQSVVKQETQEGE